MAKPRAPKQNDNSATIGRLVDDAMAAIERDYWALKGVLPVDQPAYALPDRRSLSI
jgi:hypothetical protein